MKNDISLPASKVRLYSFRVSSRSRRSPLPLAEWNIQKLHSCFLGKFATQVPSLPQKFFLHFHLCQIASDYTLFYYFCPSLICPTGSTFFFAIKTQIYSECSSSIRTLTTTHSTMDIGDYSHFVRPFFPKHSRILPFSKLQRPRIEPCSNLPCGNHTGYPLRCTKLQCSGFSLYASIFFLHSFHLRVTRCREKMLTTSLAFRYSPAGVVCF